MNTWSTVIAQLANTPSGAQAQASAQAKAQHLVRKEYCTVKQQFEDSEKQLKALESDYAAAKAALLALEQQTQKIERDTQDALAQEEAQKALSLATEIAKINLNVFNNRQQVLTIESTLNTLKGTLSHNRYNLFRLEQQLDTLNATCQLQQAQSQLAQNKGIRTALHSIATLHARAGQPTSKTAPKAKQIVATAKQPESAEQIIRRLRAVK